jgi:O-antigen/teichoic acid export membrane protein
VTAAGGAPRFRDNVAATLAGRLGAMAIALVFATLLTRWMGLARYGTWSVFAAFLGFSSVLDFGLGVAVERAVAHADAGNQPARIPHLVHAARTLAAILGFAVGLLSLTAVAVLPPDAWRAIGEPDEARQAALMLPVAFTLNLQAAVWAATLTGLRRSAEAHLLRVAGTAAAAFVTALSVVRRGSDVAEMLLYYSVVIFLSGGVIAWRVYVLTGQAHWPRWPGRWDGAAARALAGVGGAVQLSTLAAQAGDLALRSILGARFGPAAIGAYDLATRAAMAPRHAASAVPVALVPQAQAQAVSAGPASLAALHARSVLLVALVVVGGTAGAWLLVGPLLALWLGTRPELGDLTPLVHLLLVFHAVLAIGAVASAIGRALGRPGPEAIAAVLGNIAGVVAAGLAGNRDGAVATFATMVAASTAAQALWIARREGLRWPGPGHALRVLGVSTAAFAGAWVAARVDAPAPLHLALAITAAGTAALLAALGLGVFRAGRLAAPVSPADAASIADGR